MTRLDRTTERHGWVALLAASVVAALLPTAAVAVAPPAAGAAWQAAAAAPADEAQDFPFPGADTIALHNGSDQYVTYGASAGGRKVPYAVSGSGDVVGTSPVVAGDALPGGGGAWVADGAGIWTPGAFYHVKDGVGRYYLFYTAIHRNDGDRRCIGVASSTNPFGGFRAEAQPIVCPDKGDRWALDADVTTGPEGAIWMTWRDGQRAEGPESALSVMMLKFNADGTVDRNSDPVVIMRSDALAWAHHQQDGGVTVIENPSALFHNGSWYLFYSGNSWPTNYYATGIAHCGAKIDDGLCSQLPGPNRAWFSYSGPQTHLPDSLRLYGLPGNKRGPGALDVYRARDGKPWVTWNYLSDGGGRKSRVGRLVITGSGANADFRVTL
ncbi:family 43 glycosylhydrolase [Catellatospora methionotrophica]|uniref:family 43 glycosylhydrolase n=1 Tax=Catellatospora methionotrophica TaxID=121620 RepID=UPI0033EFC462